MNERFFAPCPRGLETALAAATGRRAAEVASLVVDDGATVAARYLIDVISSG